MHWCEYGLASARRTRKVHYVYHKGSAAETNVREEGIGKRLPFPLPCLLPMFAVATLGNR
jgi:hypothetical protein